MLCSPATTHYFVGNNRSGGGKFMSQTIRLDQAQYVDMSESKDDVSLHAVHQEMLGTAEHFLGQSPRSRTQISA
jgi:hypothetical protein